MRALRFFDKMSVGSVCHVMWIWRGIFGNIKQQVAKCKQSELMTKNLWDAIIAAVATAEKDFHFPLYSAGMVLSPLHNTALTVDQTPNGVQKRIEATDETVDQVAIMFRRFDAAGCGKPREEILAETTTEPRLSDKSLNARSSNSAPRRANFCQ